MGYPLSLLSEFDTIVNSCVVQAASQIAWLARQTSVTDIEFAEAITIASRPICKVDVPFVLADLLQSHNYDRAKLEVERWTNFRGGSSLAPPDQNYRKEVLGRLAVALNNAQGT